MVGSVVLTLLGDYRDAPSGWRIIHSNNNKNNNNTGSLGFIGSEIIIGAIKEQNVAPKVVPYLRNRSALAVNC